MHGNFYIKPHYHNTFWIQSPFCKTQNKINTWGFHCKNELFSLSLKKNPKKQQNISLVKKLPLLLGCLETEHAKWKYNFSLEP